MTTDSVGYLAKALNIIEEKVGEMGGEIGCGIEINVGPGPVHTATIHLIFPSHQLREYISHFRENSNSISCEAGKGPSLSMDGISEPFNG
jgi:hypothetical protein